MTERAVRVADLALRPKSAGEPYDSVVESLWAEGTSLTRNRAFVTAQYFDGMKTSFREMERVLRIGGYMIMIVGTSNRICGRNVPTAQLIEELASSCSLKTELRFEHALANRSSMRMNRSITGGEVKTETVLVMRRS
jgi:hypothetical protein